MRNYDTPGVYYERTDASGAGIQVLRTDVVGFVGIAERGPIGSPIPIESWRQFEANFGSFIGGGYLAYTVRAFFENGGRRCWVVRVASDLAGTAEVIVKSHTTGAPRWRISAYSPGVWGNELEVELRQTHRGQARSIPRSSTPEYSVASSLAGFSRGTHVCISQVGWPTQWKVISETDPFTNRIYWVHPDRAARGPWDEPLGGFMTDESILIQSVEYSVLVRDRGRLDRVYEGLSLIPHQARYGPYVVAVPNLRDMSEPTQSASNGPELIVIRECEPEEASLNSTMPLDIPVISRLRLQGGADGLTTLSARDFTGEELLPSDDDEARARKVRGIMALNEIGEVAMVAVPDIHVRPVERRRLSPVPCVPDRCLPLHPPDPMPVSVREPDEMPPVFGDEEVFGVESFLVTQCEKRRDRFAILVAPFSTVEHDNLGSAAIRQWRQRFESSFAALYYPWLKVVDPLRDYRSPTRTIPPSGHVAGQFAKGDLSVGVYKAPANIALNWAEDVTVQISDGEHGALNACGVNAIRALPGRGLRVYGARTVSSDIDWRFVNVRRLMLMVEKAIDISLQWVVFEPNDHLTRAKVALVLRSFLHALWQQGALVGSTPDAAFFVKCDDANNPGSERTNGRLLAEIGVAVSQPSEFVLLQVGRVSNALEVYEAGTVASKGQRE